MNQTAQGLAALGRGPDTQLVHMTPGEVKSLQQLAMAGGGSLTINPATGLPEAGFLSSMLPMLIGAGITAATGGAAAPWMIGLGVGGVQAARTGSISKGLMAGLGAYGGAGLGAGLSQAGAQTAANTQLAGDAAYKAAQESALAQAEALGKNALPYTPEGFAAQAKGITAPLNTMQETALAGQKEAFTTGGFGQNLKTMGSGISSLGSEAGRSAFMQGAGGGKGLLQAGLAATAPMMETTTKQPELAAGDASMGQRYSYTPGAVNPMAQPDVPAYGQQGQNFGREQTYFNPSYAQISDEQAKKLYGFAGGGPVENMSSANAIGASTGFPQSDIRTGAYSTPFQQPMGQNVVTGAQDAAVNPYTGQAQFAAGGGVNDQYNLGGYSDGGRLLRGPGDGVSDDIPAMIGKKQPARLADGEFVVPARIVSELGNGSTEAGARKLYAMMERVQKARGKTVGKNKVATNSRAEKHLPA